MTEVQDLKCGDLFTFRKDKYICLSNFTDDRHTQSIVTAITLKSPEKSTNDAIFVLRLFRTFEVEVTDKHPLHLKIVENTAEEVQKSRRLNTILKGS